MKAMIRTGCAALAAAALAMSAAADDHAGEAATPALADQLAGLLDAESGFSGLALIGDETGLLAEFSRGFADEPAGRALRADDVWRWASITKQAVGVLVMQEVEAGRLKLDDRIDALLPARDFGRAGAATVEDLLRHTSGLANPDSATATQIAEPGFDPVAFCTQSRSRGPQARFSYNNCDYVVLGLILEASAGASWERLAQDRLFEPAGMSRSFIAAPDRADTVYGHDADGALIEHAPIALYGASAAMIGDPRDLLLFDNALLSGAYLGEAARNQLWAGDPALGYVALGVWSFAAPLSGCEGAVRLIERRGDIGGVRSRNIIAPDLGRSLIVFINTPDFQFGEIWTGRGGAHGLASLAFCGAMPAGK